MNDKDFGYWNQGSESLDSLNASRRVLGLKPLDKLPEKPNRPGLVWLALSLLAVLLTAATVYQR